jgi:putative peptidoglycan lipid II flippase
VLSGYFAGSIGQRLVGTVALISAGSIVYFALAWITGGMDREDLLVLLRRKKVEG